MTARCSSCGAPIVWAKTARLRKRIPLDEAETPDGNILLIDGIAHVGGIGPGNDSTAPANAQGTRHKSHFATCPNAAQHRGRGKR